MSLKCQTSQDASVLKRHLSPPNTENNLQDDRIQANLRNLSSVEPGFVKHGLNVRMFGF